MDTNRPEALREGMQNSIDKEIGVKVAINTAIKLGENTCLVELNSGDDKRKVMQNESKLKATHRKVYINDGMTKKEREIQAKIRNHAKGERINGKSVKIGFQKLIINDEVWGWNREKDRLEIIKYKSKN